MTFDQLFLAFFIVLGIVLAVHRWVVLGRWMRETAKPPKIVRPPRVFVLAMDYPAFTNWCCEQDPIERATDPKFIVFSNESSLFRGHGFHWEEGDRFVVIGNPQPWWPQVGYMLGGCGVPVNAAERFA